MIFGSRCPWILPSRDRAEVSRIYIFLHVIRMSVLLDSLPLDPHYPLHSNMSLPRLHSNIRSLCSRLLTRHVTLQQVTLKSGHSAEGYSHVMSLCGRLLTSQVTLRQVTFTSGHSKQFTLALCHSESDGHSISPENIAIGTMRYNVTGRKYVRPWETRWVLEILPYLLLRSLILYATFKQQVMTSSVICKYITNQNDII